ncbi:tRNA lysidine(34) synthetase TilS [Pontiellaceae bacterium B12227]|nr:tRNA lysidine(34) synthetase TilS [Pontiellaceae bacterium B12227]
MNLPDLIKENLQKHHLLPPDQAVVVGVSGGGDSVALLRVFRILEIPCTVAHLNHQLRGDESAADEHFVRALAAELDFPMVGKSVDVKQLAETTGQSIEMAARQARHDFFAEFEDSVIALAHHADDQVETFVLKLARGAGTDGLCGMPFFQSLEKLQIIRPMLNVPRAGIFQWLEENGHRWREDSSNSDENFLRNKVRHTILPMLGNELNPNIRETILRTMDILRAENEWMSDLINDCRLPIAELPLAAQRRKLRNWLFEQGAESVGFEAVEQVLKLMEAGEGSAIYELNSRQRVVVEYGTPRFEATGFQPLELSWTLSCEPGTGWIKDESRIGEYPASASVSAEKVGDSEVLVRNWRPGDRIGPLGMEGTRKIQDILTDLKVPKARRNNVPVVECRAEIIWVPGYRIARGWELKKSSDDAIHFKLERNRTE